MKRPALALAAAVLAAGLVVAAGARRAEGPSWKVPRWGRVGRVESGWHFALLGRIEAVPPAGYRLRFDCLTREGAKRPRQVQVRVGGFDGPAAALRGAGVATLLAEALRDAACGEASADELRSALAERGFTGIEARLLEGGPAPADPALAAELARRVPESGRVLLVGLDGADWQFLDPLIAAGRMPHLAAISNRGARGTLRSFQPLLSPLIWTTIATGVAPEEHGVLDFFERGPGGEAAMIGSGARKVPAVWNVLSALDVDVGVIGWWASHPAEQVAGLVVSNRINNSTFPGAEETDLSGVVWPPSWTERVGELRVPMAAVSGERIRGLARVSDGEIAKALEPTTAPGHPLRMLIQTVSLTETTQRLAVAAWQELQPRLLMVYFEGTDGIGHLFAPYVAPPIAGASAATVERYGETPAAYYAWIDGLLGELAALLGPDDTLILCSDHGFQWGDGRPPTTASGTLERNAPAWHRLDGMVVVSGARAKGGARGEGSVYDIAPTLLALFGQPPGPTMSGRTLEWALADPPAPAPPVDYARLVTLQRAAPDRAASPEELEQLRALGYIGGAAPAPSAAPAGEELTGGALNNLGARKLDSGDLAGAEDAFRRAIAAQPDYGGAYRNLANVLLRRGRAGEAVETFLRAEPLLPELDTAAVEMALALVEAKQRARAIALLGELARKRPRSYLLHVNLGTFLAQDGQMQAALDAYRRACELEPRSSLAWRNRGSAALRLGLQEEAALAFTRSLELDPNQPDLLRMVRP